MGSSTTNRAGSCPGESGGAFNPGNTLPVLVKASKNCEDTPTVLADGGVENVNGRVDELMESGLIRRVLAQTELRFSNSMIEAWWRALKHQWLFSNTLDSVTTVEKLVAFYVGEHNERPPHSAFRWRLLDSAIRTLAPLDTTWSP